jgi:hypothetical protein
MCLHPLKKFSSFNTVLRIKIFSKDGNLADMYFDFVLNKANIKELPS